MSARQLATVAFAIVGVVILLDAAVGLVSLAVLCIPLGDGSDSSAAWFPLYILGSSLAYLAAGLWLVLRGHRLARRLFPEPAPVAVDLEVDQLLMAALMVLGIWMVTVGLGDVASRTLWANATKDVTYEFYPLGDLITGFVSIGIGVFLILKPRRLVGVWRQYVFGEEPAGVS